MRVALPRALIDSLPLHFAVRPSPARSSTRSLGADGATVNHVAELEAMFLPLLREAAVRIAEEHPSFKFSVWSSSVGGATAYQGHNLGIECTFPDAAAHEADCVAASIGVMHLSTEPMLSEFGVEWGSGNHPDVRVEFVEHAAPLTQEALNEIATRFPELMDVFRTALYAWASRNTRA